MKYAPYSFSKISTHQNCAMRFKLQYVDKIKMPWVKNKALEKGGFIHHIIEKRLLNEDVRSAITNYKITEHDSYKDMLPLIKDILLSDRMKRYTESTYPKYVEEGFGLYIDSKGIELGTYKKMNGISPTIRGYIDFMIDEGKTVRIIDHKTGKFKEDQNKLQLLIYFLVAVLKFPNATNFIVQFDFVEHNKSIEFEFSRDMFEENAREVMSVIKSVETDNEFKKQDTFCNWCPFFGKYCDGIVDKSEELVINSF